MAWRSHLFAAVRHPREPKLLLLRSDRQWRLPHVLVRDGVWEADTKVVIPALERRLATRLWLLRLVHSAQDEEAKRIDAIFEVELLDSRWEAPGHGRWAGRAELAGLRLSDEAQRPVLDRYLDALERGDVPQQRPPWARPGWLAGVRAWIEAEVARLGRTVVAIEQVKHWSISAVLRVETDGSDIYFKVPARLPYFVEEATVTARLAERFPDHVPMPLAIEPEAGWLLLPQFDELFPWRAPPDVHREALRRFAALQRQSSELVDELLADGCLDRRLDVLETQIDPLVNDPEAVARLTPDEVKELRRLAPALKETCRRLAALGLPLDARARRPAHAQRRPRRWNARLLRLERRVHRPPVHRPPLAALGAGRGEPRGVTRGLPGALGGRRDAPSGCRRPWRSPRSSSRCTTPFPTSTSSPASSPMPSRSWMPRRGSCGASFGSASC